MCTMLNLLSIRCIQPFLLGRGICSTPALYFTILMVKKTPCRSGQQFIYITNLISVKDSIIDRVLGG